MNFQIRQAIADNVSGQAPEEFSDIVNDAIERGEEHLLPGLGVFLEKWWQAASPTEQHAFSEKLAQVFTS